MTTNTVFQLRRNSVSGTRPTTTTVAPGELAINTTDGILFSANSTVIFEVGANNTSIAVGNSTVRQTANSTGVYVNGSLSVAATGTLVLSNGAGIQANGSVGTAGQLLTSNGSGVYWSAANAGISSIVSQQFTANGTANSFTVSGGYIPSAIEVYVAGVKQIPGTDVTITSGSTVNFAVAPLNGQIVDVFGYVSTGSISSYLALTGGTLSGNLTFTNGSVIVSNGSFGTNGQVLTSNGTSMYWSSAGFTNGQSISVNNFTVTGAFTANSSNGSAGQVLTTNGTGVYWSSAGVNTSAQYTWTNTHNFANVITFSTANAIILPVGNTASRPAASNGMIRYNTNTGLVEAVAGSTWTGLMAAYSSVREQFTASNNQTTFTVTGGYVSGQIDVYYNGVKLRSGSEVNVSSGSTVVLATGAANNALIEVVGIGPTFVVSNTAQIVYQQFTATNNQTTFTVTNGYVPGQVDVFADGIHLVNGVDVNVSSGSTVVLSTGVPNNTIVEVKGYSTPLVSAQSSTAVRQTFTANSTVNNNFTVTGGYIPGQVDVFYNGAKLVNGSDVNTSSGTTIVLTSNAVSNAIVDVVGINYFTAGGGVTTPVRQQLVATANQTTFTVTGGYTPGQIDVFRNGVKLTPGADVNISGGSTVVLTSAAANGDNVDVVGFAATSYQDSVRKSGDTMSGALAISSNLAVTGVSTLTGNVTTSGVFTDSTGTIRPIVQGTSQTATGTAIDFTGIPSWVRRVTVMFNGVSTNGSSIPQVQIGSGSFTTSGYVCTSGRFFTTNNAFVDFSTTGFSLNSGVATNTFTGHLIITNIGGNVWVASGNFGGGSTNIIMVVTSGSVTLSGILDRLRLTTVNGTDTFDAGTINILYE